MTPSRPAPLVSLVLSALLVLGVAACGSGEDGSAAAQTGGPGSVSVASATIDWPANPRVAAVRMVVRNGTATDDALVSVSSPVARTTTLHRSGTDDAGRSVMAPVDEVPVAARSSVTFAPGGLHVMLTGITEDLEVGDRVDLTLRFQHAGTVHATAEVVEPGSAGEDTEGTHDH
jgi:copper(I)-binding protein